MPLIDSNGLFDGDRICSCSPEAQLYYPRLLCVSNGFGRIKISYVSIVARAFQRWAKEAIPSEEKLTAIILEFVENRLLYTYRSGGEVWGQWDTKKGTFGKYQTTEDNRSPAPPEIEYLQWIECNRKVSAKLSEPCGNLAEILRNGSENLRHGVGVGVGVGVSCKVLGVGEGVKQKPSARKARGAETDLRFYPSREFIKKCCEHFKVPFVWGAGEGTQLSRFLKEAPQLSLEEVQALIRNRFKSKEPKGNPPRKWLMSLSIYAEGPLNKFHNTEGNGATPVSAMKTVMQRLEEQRLADEAEDAKKAQVQ